MNSTEIARLAGVSRSTVSKVVNNYPDISLETRKLVLDTIEKYSYVPNAFGQNLKGVPNRVIGLFVVDLSPNDDDNFTICRSDVFIDYISYAADIAQNLKYNILISILRKKNTDDLQKLLFSNSIVGGIVIGDTLDKQIIDRIADRGCKICLHNQRPSSTSSNIINVNVDNENFGYSAAKYLYNEGYSRIAVATGSFNRYTVQQRFKGILKAVSESNLFIPDNYIGIGDFHREEGGYQAVMQIFQNSKDCLPDSIIVSNSVMLSGALEAILDFGLKIPDDISVVCIGRSRFTEHCQQAVTIIDFDHKSIAAITVSKLIELIEIGDLSLYDYLISDFDLFHNFGNANSIP